MGTSFKIAPNDGDMRKMLRNEPDCAPGILTVSNPKRNLAPLI